MTTILGLAQFITGIIAFGIIGQSAEVSNSPEVASMLIVLLTLGLYLNSLHALTRVNNKINA